MYINNPKRTKIILEGIIYSSWLLKFIELIRNLKRGETINHLYRIHNLCKDGPS